MTHRKEFLTGVKAGLPVCIGFIPIAIAYAVSAIHSGLTPGQTVTMSLIVFAGASQMAAVNMLAAGAGAAAVVLATFILNLRHFIMSACVMKRLDKTPLLARMGLSPFVTDESFALFTADEAVPGSPYAFLGLIAATYLPWVLGTVLGCFMFSLLPPLVADSLGVALPALFISLLVPGVRKSLRLFIVVALTAVLNTALSAVMSGSWALIASTLLGALAGVFITEEKEAAQV
jgi:4-azaleucine resistance transporter AzlC